MSLVSVTGVTSDGSVSADSEDKKQLNWSFAISTMRFQDNDLMVPACRNEVIEAHGADRDPYASPGVGSSPPDVLTEASGDFQHLLD